MVSHGGGKGGKALDAAANQLVRSQTTQYARLLVAAVGM